MNICPKCSDQKKNIIHAYDYPECDGLRGGYELKNVEENKSWNEFIEWAKDYTKEGEGFFNYYSYEEFGKVGLLICYLKTRKDCLVLTNDLTQVDVEYLENVVKFLKPKEDSEIEDLARELLGVYINNPDVNLGHTPYKKDWIAVAKKAIEIIRGEK